MVLVALVASIMVVKGVHIRINQELCSISISGIDLTVEREELLDSWKHLVCPSQLA